jgi:D-arabinose 1-dehydrogenase-like Zn-dependent alcohol dehydrogenase
MGVIEEVGAEVTRIGLGDRVLVPFPRRWRHGE